jgi:CheY-like chemotaxis protein
MLRIFLLDDDVYVKEYFGFLLEDLPVETRLTYCSNSEEAVKATENEKYDLYFLDFDLGDGKTGLEFCRQHLKERAREVIFHTGRSAEDLEEFCKQHRSKPISRADLLVLIQSSGSP